MDNFQRQRLHSAWKIVSHHENEIDRLERQLNNLKTATDITFSNSGNCEASVRFEREKDPTLLTEIKDAACESLQKRIREHQKALNGFPPHYVEKGK